jgi:aquaporin Z
LDLAPGRLRTFAITNAQVSETSVAAERLVRGAADDGGEMSMSNLGKRLLAEAAGTAWLVFIGCGSMVLSAGTGMQGVGLLGVSLAFGLSFTTMAYAIGPVSGAHMNPAVTVGFAIAQRFSIRDLVPYIAAQVVGAALGAWLLAYVAGGRPGFDLAAVDFGVNGYGDHSPFDYRLHAAAASEFVMSFVLVMVNLMVSGRKVSRVIAPAAVGSCVALIYLVSIPVTNGAANPARSTGPALFVGGWALDQLWLFWAAPMAAAVLAGLLFPRVKGRPRKAAAVRQHCHSELR